MKAVLDLRRKHPFMGKAPIQRMLEHKGPRLSVSTVGRILSCAIATGVVPLASICEGRVKPRCRRGFDGWARRWNYGDKAERPGQLVQIDHMTFSRDGQTIKEFRAICPVSRFMVARVFSRATAFNARRFLDCDLTVKAVSTKLLKHEFFYNYQRPHSALDYLSPNEYLVAREAA